MLRPCVRASLTCLALTLAGCSKEPPKSGVEVNAPGVSVKAGPGGVEVTTPGAEVKVK